jgi:hypothetical protein
MAGIGLGKPVIDPLAFAGLLWPNVKFYPKQKEILYSVVENVETVVVAGHELGKDFISAFIVLWFFLSRWPCRVVTTSADHAQLEGVLWGEMRRFIQTSKYPLEDNKGGPLVVNHLHLRRILPGKEGKPRSESNICGVSYCRGRVAAKGEGMLGHHVTPDSAGYVDDGIPRTLFVADEASGVDDISYNGAESWAKRKLIIGNPYPCTNFFIRAVEGGDILMSDVERMIAGSKP